MTRIGRGVGGCLMIALLLGSTSAAFAAGPQSRSYDLPAQSLGDALGSIARQSQVEIITPTELVDGRTAPAVKGDYAPLDAIRFALEGSGLVVERVGDAFIVKRSPGTQEGTGEGAIVVTGTRIRGAAVASPIIAIDGEAMRNAGQATLGDVVRQIPQNFGGGQNPGIGFNVPATSGADVGGGSSLNLRGLGSDATLTLLNGHRLSYSASRQSVDISAIPLDAVERIEIVADGASALYGSDAVAGVANIILKRDHEGLGASARLGASTDGGNVQQRYGAIAGTRWGQGGVLAAYEFGRNSAIEARERDYAADRAPGLTLYPAIKHHSAVIAGHQALTPGLSVKLDALYNKRWSGSRFPLARDQSFRGISATTAESFAVAPSLDLSASDWRVALAGMLGDDRVRFRTDTYAGDSLAGRSGGRYRNAARSIELAGDGPLFKLPGGPARVALGAGYRSNDFSSVRSAGSIANIDRSQDSCFAYGELSLPILSPAQKLALVKHLSASAALRYERYPGIDSVVTPKLGLIYAPLPDVELKASWGKSFRAPTFFQQYQLQSAYLVNATSLGGGGAPPGSTALLIEGGNPELEPERATSWSATVVLQPQVLPDARLEVSYFDVDYRDRIVTPIGFIAQALTNPIYRELIQLSPSDAAKAAAIAGAGQFVNATAAPYDPARVVAIVDNGNRNAGRQSVRGVDVLAHYTHDLGDAGALRLDLNASYLTSRQRLSAGQPMLPLSGLIFNPPHWRARGTLGWDTGALTLTGAVSHIGSVRDERFTPAVRVDGMTTFDLTARYRVEAGPSLLRDLDIVLSAQNLFNDKPDVIRTTLAYDTPYDSTNDSPVGRVVSLGIAKSW